MEVYGQLKFTLQGDIGAEGKNSDVYTALDNQLDTVIAVKKLEKSKIKDPTDYFDEARKLSLSKHQNVVEVKYACMDNDNIYIAMPFYKCGSVNSIMNQRYLTVREIIKYSLEFLSGLHHIHTLGLVHFDVKPTNILISDENTALLTDFGLAKQLDNYGFANPGKMYGKHFTPEWFLQSEYTSDSDIYQAGLTLYRMCNGNDLFNSQFSVARSDLRKAILSGNFPNRKLYLAHIPKKLRNVINKALNTDIKDRYDTVLEIINDLASIDKSLDWVYNYDKNTCSHTWDLDCTSNIKTIRLCGNNGKWEIMGIKTMKASGRKTKISDWCNSDHTDFKKAQKFIEDIVYSI